MATKILVNLPVQDLEKSKDFFGKLGYSFNPHFTDEAAACMIISDDIYAMLLTHTRFKDFTPKAVANAHQTSEVLLALSFNSRAAVDAMMTAVLGAGGTEARNAEDLGFMYSRSYNDLDGHIWELIWMDESAIPQD